MSSGNLLGSEDTFGSLPALALDPHRRREFLDRFAYFAQWPRGAVGQHRTALVGVQSGVLCVWSGTVVQVRLELDATLRHEMKSCEHTLNCLKGMRSTHLVQGQCMTECLDRGVGGGKWETLSCEQPNASHGVPGKESGCERDPSIA